LQITLVYDIIFAVFCGLAERIVQDGPLQSLAHERPV
jgi:hypothetical protein